MFTCPAIKGGSEKGIRVLYRVAPKYTSTEINTHVLFLFYLIGGLRKKKQTKKKTEKERKLIRQDKPGGKITGGVFSTGSWVNTHLENPRAWLEYLVDVGDFSAADRTFASGHGDRAVPAVYFVPKT